MTQLQQVSRTPRCPASGRPWTRSGQSESPAVCSGVTSASAFELALVNKRARVRPSATKLFRVHVSVSPSACRPAPFAPAGVNIPLPRPRPSLRRPFVKMHFSTVIVCARPNLCHSIRRRCPLSVGWTRTACQKRCTPSSSLHCLIVIAACSSFPREGGRRGIEREGMQAEGRQRGCHKEPGRLPPMGRKQLRSCAEMAAADARRDL